MKVGLLSRGLMPSKESNHDASALSFYYGWILSYPFKTTGQLTSDILLDSDTTACISKKGTVLLRTINRHRHLLRVPPCVCHAWILSCRTTKKSALPEPLDAVTDVNLTGTTERLKVRKGASLVAQSGKNLQCTRPRFDPWVGTTP